MNSNLWIFLDLSVFMGVSFLVILLIVAHKQKMKKLEIESLKIANTNMQEEVKKAVKGILGDQLSRIEVLEAIVTDKHFELSEKITRLK